MESRELRFEVTEEMLRELLWHAMAPNATVFQGELNKALEQQQERLGVSLDGYQLTGISIVNDRGTMYAEFMYTRAP